MKDTETVQLIALARAAFPGMSIVEGMPHVWHGALGDLPYAECADAIVEHSKVSTGIVTVADIRRLVSLARVRVAGEERQHEIEARRAPVSRELVQMPDWFRTSVEEHRRRARAARQVAADAGEPLSFGEAISLVWDRHPR